VHENHKTKHTAWWVLHSSNIWHCINGKLNLDIAR